MEAGSTATITIEATVHRPVEQVWAFWTEPDHITKYSFASDDWHSPWAKNDLRVGGKFVTRMEAKDGSFGFDFEGVYDDVKENAFIAYTMDDGRKVAVTFTEHGDDTEVTVKFDAEQSNPIEMQKAGWQAILNNFKKYCETTDLLE